MPTQDAAAVRRGLRSNASNAAPTERPTSARRAARPTRFDSPEPAPASKGAGRRRADGPSAKKQPASPGYAEPTASSLKKAQQEAARKVRRAAGGSGGGGRSPPRAAGTSPAR